MLRKYGFEYSNKGHLGAGECFFPAVKNDSDLQKLKEFIREYRDYCGGEPKLD
jgi:hypothetical protein